VASTWPPTEPKPDREEIASMSTDSVSKAPRRDQAAEDQVRVAYGAVPLVLEGLSADDPIRTDVRDRARSLLLESGYLTSQELDTLTVKDAIAAVLRRIRAETRGTAQALGQTPRP
jgi:hypothetical protein